MHSFWKSPWLRCIFYKIWSCSDCSTQYYCNVWWIFFSCRNRDFRIRLKYYFLLQYLQSEALRTTTNTYTDNTPNFGFESECTRSNSSKIYSFGGDQGYFPNIELIIE